MSFFDDGRRLLIAQESELWVYDLRLACVVHSQQMPAEIASISVSTDSATVALVYVGMEGVYLYKNRELMGLSISSIVAAQRALDPRLALSSNDPEDEKVARSVGLPSPQLSISIDRLRTSRLLDLLNGRQQEKEVLAQFGGKLRRAKDRTRAPLWMELKGVAQRPGARGGGDTDNALDNKRGNHPGGVTVLDLDASVCSRAFSAALRDGCRACADLLASRPMASLDLDVLGLRGDDILLWLVRLDEMISGLAGDHPGASFDLVSAVFALTLRHHQSRLATLPAAAQVIGRISGRIGREYRRAREMAELIYGFSEELREVREVQAW